MKNYFKVLGIIVLSIIIGFSITACDNGTGSGGSGGGGELSVTGGGGASVTITENKLTLAGKVFTMEEKETGIKFTEFKESMTLDSISGGSGGITSGTLSYTITSAPTELEDLYESFLFNLNKEWGWDDVTASVSDANYFIIGTYDSHLGNDNYLLSLGKVALSGSMYYYTLTGETTYFIYVDKAVIISGTGKTDNHGGGSWTEKTENFEISLTEGWNALCIKVVSTPSMDTVTVSKMTTIPNTFTWVIREIY